MTREDAFEIWLPIIKMGVKSMPECSEAIDMAIKALKQEPCDDAISRQAVLEVIRKCHCEEWVKADIGAPIEALQSVTLAEKVGQWIPVSERLPEDGQNVLFSTKTDRVFEGKYYADTSAHNWLSYKDDTYAWNNVVTAWMPLPEPYKASPTGAEKET